MPGHEITRRVVNALVSGVLPLVNQRRRDWEQLVGLWLCVFRGHCDVNGPGVRKGGCVFTAVSACDAYCSALYFDARRFGAREQRRSVLSKRGLRVKG